MSDLGDPTCWTDREREFFAAGWNECVKMQPGQIERLRAALSEIRDGFRTEIDWSALESIRRYASETLNQQQAGDSK